MLIHLCEFTGAITVCVCVCVLVGKAEGKRPLRRPWHRWVDNIRTDLQEVGCGSMDLIELAEG